MEEFTLDFYGEKISILKPKDLTSLRAQITKKLCFKESDAEEILIYYFKEEKEKQYIQNEEDLSNFLTLNLYILYLDIDPNSNLYAEYKSKIEKEISKSKASTELEELIQKKNDISVKEEEYLKHYSELLSALNRQLDIYQAKKLDLVMTKKKKIQEFEEQKEKIDKKIQLLQENNEILKATPSKNKYIENNNYLSFNRVKEVLDNVVEKVKNVTYDYIFKRFESSEKCETIEKEAVQEIDNLSKIVIKQTADLLEDVKGVKEKKYVLKNPGKIFELKNEINDLCEQCEEKMKHKYDHLSVKIIDEGEEIVFRGTKCKQCGRIIWEKNN